LHRLLVRITLEGSAGSDPLDRLIEVGMDGPIRDQLELQSLAHNVCAVLALAVAKGGRKFPNCLLGISGAEEDGLGAEPMEYLN